MTPRIIAQVLHSRLAAFPAVALLGPRQCGKTTLAKSLHGQYFDVEREQDRLFVNVDWHTLTASDRLLVFDEAQNWPELFSRLRGTIDRDRKRNGRFLLLGSVSPALMTQVSQSLAGRLALVELTPFAASEIPKNLRGKHWLVGGYPDGGYLDESVYPRWHTSYVDQLAYRDLPTWGLQATPQTTRRLVRMIATLHGQVWNASRIGRSLGLSYHTVNRYVDFLEGAYLVRRLWPYHANIRKRLVKRPKLYLRDTGLLHALLNIPDEKALLYHPWVGASWEGYVIEQVLAALQHADRIFQAHFFRTSDQKECDLVVETDGELWAIETKLTSQPRLRDMQRLNASADLIGADRRFLVCRRSEPMGGERQMVCDLDGMLRFIRKRSAPGSE